MSDMLWIAAILGLALLGFGLIALLGGGNGEGASS